MDGLGTQWLVGAVIAAPALALFGKAAVSLWKIGHTVGRIEYELKNGVVSKLDQVRDLAQRNERRLSNLEIGIAVLQARCPYCPTKLEGEKHERDDRTEDGRTRRKQGGK